jgi:hypothetical protein
VRGQIDIAMILIPDARVAKSLLTQRRSQDVDRRRAFGVILSVQAMVRTEIRASQYCLTIAPEIIACVKGIDPTVHDLSRVAKRIAREGERSHPAFSRGGAVNDGSLRLTSFDRHGPR